MISQQTPQNCATLAASYQSGPMTPTCNLCGANSWVDMGSRKNVRCAQCGSLERTRALKFVLEHLGFPPPSARVLHFAPEKGLTRWFQSLAGVEYDACDLEPKRYPHASVRRFDLAKDAPSLPSDYYDLIVHCHVMEHVPCNLAYVFYFLHRALRAGGLHVFCVPFFSGYYDECFAPLPREEAERRFGQYDHVRRFGANDIERHLGAFLRMPQSYSLHDYGTVEEVNALNIPEKERQGWSSSTILVLKRDDYLLVPADHFRASAR